MRTQSRDGAEDQNGNPVKPDIHAVVRKDDGKKGYARTVWFGWRAATNITVNIYATRKDAENGNIADTYENTPGLLSVCYDNWEAS